MHVWRKWILPIAKGVLLLVAVVSLAVLAFSPGGGRDEAVPTGALADPEVSPVRATVTNDLSVPASVRADDAQEGKAPLSGTIVDVFVQKDAEVTAGQVLASIRQEKPREPIQNPDGTTTPREPEVLWEDVTAPATGRIVRLDMIARQEVTAGQVVVRVTPSTLIVEGNIPAAQRYRLAEQPSGAQVTIPGGPEAFECTDLRIDSGSAEQGTEDAQTAGQASTTDGASSRSRVSCRVPDGVQAFAGLEATMLVHAGVVEDVLTLPTTAVRGASGSGRVIVLGADGSREERQVVLGLSDGTVIEIREGLVEGERVLEFFPGQPSPSETCTIDQVDGREYCERIEPGGTPGEGSPEQTPEASVSKSQEARA
ncbi:MAG: HlyD family efflux transporter periplasmic adaptor subunit [Pseudoclavibacter sp.]|nr:HlyD family efflux transporter periplasmic adaptor subunit [Pseudoclavibacter sp.]